ncbi:hypothetical protein SAMN04488542_10568 [Fontibacillus panacisegetis]|uniref:Uncharacterized protein n=1 Tax=Fontibacillus panacisegetis TaxID=670482 RepID=A0A1G7HXZ8_9BACL|nr:hypothetical protein [Fontibacillus panacisegetis]SDF05004.1 hypothetical protein SAMN04488542_10568 [Fontibacillus panacisegetis]
MNATDNLCSNCKILLPGSASRYYTEDGTAIDAEKLLEGIRELGADTTEIEAYLNSLDTGEDCHGKLY